MKKSLFAILVLALTVFCFVSCNSDPKTASLTSIEISTNPAKTEYLINEKLDLTGMVVKATYSSGKSKVVTGYTVNKDVLDREGKTTVTVIYRENYITKTANFEVTVKYPTYKVTFLKNNTAAKEPSSAEKTVTYNSAYGELPTVSMDNYTFLGWYDEPSGGNEITKQTTVTKNKDHYLYAQWVENGKFKVQFNGNDATSGNAPDTIEGYLGQDIVLPGNIGKNGTDILVKTGYTFTGWAPKPEEYNSGAFITSAVERKITLYAQWKANEYTITYKDMGDASCTATINTSPTKHTYGTETILVNPIKDSGTTGAEFLGWYTDSACSDNKKVTTLAAADYTENITLYAKWRGWVQLWEGGPKFAEFNIGSTITDYASANQTTNGQDAVDDPLYCTANVGGLYTWGGRADARDTYTDDHYTDSYILTGDADTATKLWGSNWKMPTKAQFDDLIDDTNNTTWTWCDGLTSGGTYNRQYVSGCKLAGYKVTGKGVYAGNSIFLPAAGVNMGTVDIFNQQGINGLFWSATNVSNFCKYLNFGDSYKQVEDYGNPINAYSVRAVLAE